MKRKLPVIVDTPVQLAVCLHELIGLRQRLEADSLAARAGAQATVSDAAVGTVTQQLLGDDLSLAAVSRLCDDLTDMQSQAPVLHVTTVVALDVAGRQKVISWLRQQYHPLALVSWLTSPDIAGGVVVRTPNRVYDYSYARRLSDQQAILAKVIANV